MILVLLACASGQPAPHLSHLPTLTRTPLPTLTPTGLAPPAIALAENPSPDVVKAESATLAAPPPDPSSVEAPPPETPLEVVVQPTEVVYQDQPAPAVEAAETAPGAETAAEVAANPAPPVEAAPPEAPLATDPPLPAATPLPSDTPSPTHSAVPTDLPTETPTATSTPLPTATATSEAWAFNGVRTHLNPYDSGLLMYGNVINNTGATQELKSILGTFYNLQNQIIAGPDSGSAYWPGYTISPGGSMPFELAVNTISEAANFDLNVEAEPSDETPRQDFEFLDIEQANEEGSYCVAGELQNPGGELEDYLAIALILYDGQENMISFSYYEELDPDWVEDDDTLEFEICSDTLDQAVAHHTLQAWGR